MNANCGTRIIYIISHYYTALYNHQTFQLLFHALKSFFLKLFLLILQWDYNTEKKENKIKQTFYMGFLLYFCEMKSLIQCVHGYNIWMIKHNCHCLIAFGLSFDIHFHNIFCWLSREWIVVFPDNLDQTIQFHWIEYYYLNILIDLMSEIVSNTYIVK